MPDSVVRLGPESTAASRSSAVSVLLQYDASMTCIAQRKAKDHMSHETTANGFMGVTIAVAS